MRGATAAAIAVVFVLFLNADSSHASPVPDTGQLLCYDNATSITCPSPGQPFYGQDAQYGPNVQTFTKLDPSGNALPFSATTWVMVRDEVTGLVWEAKDFANLSKNYSNPHDADNMYTWYDGSTGTSGNDTADFIAALNGGAGFGGYSDWRLPTIQELSTIIDCNQISFVPAINTSYFVIPPLSPPVRNYWSSSSLAFDISSAWSVYFDEGFVGSYSKSGPWYARAVRGLPYGVAHTLVDNGDGTVTDNTTGLMWQQVPDLYPHTWRQALAYCQNLTLASHADWRLPNRNELQSIVDYSTYSPAINTAFFPVTPFYQWTSSTIASSPGAAWYVNFSTGSVDIYDKNSLYYVRAVRDAAGLPTTTTTSIFSADFTATPVLGPAPLEVQFSDASSPGASGHAWDFGDGTGDTGTSPTHIYQESGVYTVSLTVSGPKSIPVKNAKVAFIKVIETAPVADFRASVTEGRAPLTVLFTDTSTGAITGREWNFGDGETGKLPRMQHTFRSAGHYTVSIKVEGPDGTSIKTREAFITASPGFRTSAVSGRVTGDAQAGISINLSGKNISLTAQTGTDGSYSFGGVLNGLYRVTPICPGYVFEPAGRQIRLLGRDQTGIDFTAVSFGPDIEEAYAAPDRASADGLTQFSLFVRVTHPDGLASIQSVRANLTGIGGPSQALLRDDGTAGDAAAGDGLYTLVTTVSVTTEPGLKPLRISVLDADDTARTAFVALSVYKEFTDTVGPGAIKDYQISNGLAGQIVVFTLNVGGGGSSAPSRMRTNLYQSSCAPTVVVIAPNGTQYNGQAGGDGDNSGQITIEVPDAAAGQWTCNVSNSCGETISYGLESTIAGTGIVSGLVVDTRTGEGISGATLLSTGGINVRTDSGVYVMLHPSGIFSLSCSAVGFLPSNHSLTVNAGGYTEINMALDNGTITGGCFLKSTLGEGSFQMQTLRRFRDRVLENTAKGKKYIRLYYRYSPEILGMMQKDAELAETVYRCAGNLMPLVETMIQGGEAMPDGQQSRLLAACLEKIRAQGKPQLRVEIERILKVVEKRQPLNSLLN